jgi:hypothetical protein
MVLMIFVRTQVKEWQVWLGASQTPFHMGGTEAHVAYLVGT